MSDEHRAIVHRWFDGVWNQGNESTIDELCDPSAVIHDFPDIGGITDRGGYKVTFGALRSDFSSIRFTVGHVVS